MEYTETEIEGVWVIQPKVFDLLNKEANLNS